VVVWLAAETGSPVLDPEQLARLGQPFQRLGVQRIAGGGTGLGLSIVAAVGGARRRPDAARPARGRPARGDPAAADDVRVRKDGAA
jgi:hypothetical protein